MDLYLLNLNLFKTMLHMYYYNDINIYYINTLIRRTEMVKYLGLY